jgi:hypothetical protein
MIADLSHMYKALGPSFRNAHTHMHTHTVKMSV